MRYLPKSDSERGEMLSALGLSNVEQLISHLPADVRFDRSLPIENGKSEYEIVEYFKARARETAEGMRVFWARAFTTITARCCATLLFPEASFLLPIRRTRPRFRKER